LIYRTNDVHRIAVSVDCAPSMVFDLI